MLWVPWILVVAAVSPSQGSSCDIATTCSSCLQLGPECSWCPDQDWKGLSRCQPVERSGNCLKPESPQSTSTVIKNTPLSTGGSRNPVLIQPQHGYSCVFKETLWLDIWPKLFIKLTKWKKVLKTQFIGTSLIGRNSQVVQKIVAKHKNDLLCVLISQTSLAPVWSYEAGVQFGSI